MAISSKCINSGVAGVTCVPNSQLFATGMNGDEDLGQDIIMKGKPFHYQQVAQASPPGYETVDDQAEKVSVLQTPNAGYRTTYYGQASPPGYETVEDQAEKVSVLQTPNAGFRTTYYMGKDSKVMNMAQASPPGYETVDDQAEKLSVLQTPNAGYRTTYYAQASPPGYETVDDQAEKLSVLQTPNAGYRTTFYGQLHQLNKQGDPEPATTVVAAGPEKVSVLETPIAGTHTTFYNQMKHKKKTDPVSPENMDKWVYQISKEASGNFPNTHGVDTTNGQNHPANGGFIGQHATKYGAEIMNTPEYYFN